MKRELRDQADLVAKLEEELVARAAQISALTAVSSDYGQSTNASASRSGELEIWRKYEELNSLKNNLADRN